MVKTPAKERLRAIQSVLDCPRKSAELTGSDLARLTKAADETRELIDALGGLEARMRRNHEKAKAAADVARQALTDEAVVRTKAARDAIEAARDAPYEIDEVAEGRWRKRFKQASAYPDWLSRRKR
jgi:hypothetical protein